MATKKVRQPVLSEERVSPFNCPSCGSMKEIVKTYGNGKQVLECANCHIDKEQIIKKQLAPLYMNSWRDSELCSECGSKKRYSDIENGNPITRCADCDAIIKTKQSVSTSDQKKVKQQKKADCYQQKKQACSFCGNDSVKLSDKDGVLFECSKCGKPES